MAHQAGVIGSPISHSLSPVLHRAAYRALGLGDWSFHRDEVHPGQLSAYLASRPADWVGLAVTMPLKEEALALAQVAGAEAELVSAANTLTRHQDGWRADNTDVYGLQTALVAAGAQEALANLPDGAPPAATIVGSGATARSALVALARLGVAQVAFLVRDRLRPGVRELAEQLGVHVTTQRYADGPAQWGSPAVLVSTVPGGATPPVDGWALQPEAVVFDVVYADWPTPWASDWQGQGVPVGRGVSMLVHQAVRQVGLLTGRPVTPQVLSAMQAALAQAVGPQG